MEIKEKFIGSFIYVKELGRMVEVKEENIGKISQFKHLFNDKPKKRKRKHVRDNSKGDDDTINSELPV